MTKLSASRFSMRAVKFWPFCTRMVGLGTEPLTASKEVENPGQTSWFVGAADNTPPVQLGGMRKLLPERAGCPSSEASGANSANVNKALVVLRDRSRQERRVNLVVCVIVIWFRVLS